MSRVSRRAPRLPDRPGRFKLLARRGRRLLRPALALAGGAGVVFGVWTLGSTAMPGGAPSGSVASPHERLGRLSAVLGWRVQQVVVEGRANTPEPLLRAAIGISPGDPLLGVSLAEARARVETLPWIEHASVSRRLPGIIRVQLTERQPYAVWQNQGKFRLIDHAGQVLTDQDVTQFQFLPLVVGAGAPERAAELLDALARFPAMQSRVIAGVRVGERRWNLRMQSGTDVLLPETHVAAALERLATLQEGHDLLERPLRVIDLRLPDRLVVRALPARQPDGEGPPQGSIEPAVRGNAPRVAQPATRHAT